MTILVTSCLIWSDADNPDFSAAACWAAAEDILFRYSKIELIV
jgi:hypothetical protein